MAGIVHDTPHYHSLQEAVVVKTVRTAWRMGWLDILSFKMYDGSRTIGAVGKKTIHPL
jgi:hypothetical protein